MTTTPSYISICEQAARAAGAVLVEMLGRVKVREKGLADLVTEADLASQRLICRTVLEAFPNHCVLGEENLEEDNTLSRRAEYRWIVDPLDGTTNYVHGVPHFSVSVALERGDDLLVGVVYDPIADECFTAEAGKGAFLGGFRNGRPIHTSNVTALPNALAAIGFPPGVARQSPDLVAFLEAAEHCQALRRTGSAALNLCYLAAGRFDASWSFSTKIWDVAAGVLIIREAGGVVTAPDGSPLALETGHFSAAANEKLHGEVRKMLAQAGVV